MFGENLALPDEQWLGGPQSPSGSAVRFGTVGKLNGWI